MITEYTDRNEWKAEVTRRGLVTEVEPGCYEGMHPSDKYAAELAHRRDDERIVGHGCWIETESGDVWHGVLGDTQEEYNDWIGTEGDPF